MRLAERMAAARNRPAYWRQRYDMACARAEAAEEALRVMLHAADDGNFETEIAAMEAFEAACETARAALGEGGTG